MSGLSREDRARIYEGQQAVLDAAEAEKDEWWAIAERYEKALRRIEKKHVLEPQAARIARAALEGEDDE